MLSFSKNEFVIVGFLVRHFSARFTIRDIASRLSISAPGAHAALKKLEKNGMVVAEKLGSGLFYEVNFGSSLAEHLASMTLLSGVSLDTISGLTEYADAALYDGKMVIAISSESESVKNIVHEQKPNATVVCLSLQDFTGALRDDASGVLAVLQNGNVLLGENLILKVICEVSR
ncbi:MAG: winged helix-turn-helix domain-containing protein [Nanoarchaeota archaeon]|nr:winged helix-turn-helix domain-containing protein [Nanoarchaeota archaeon]